jgi:hypothetical protein
MYVIANLKFTQTSFFNFCIKHYSGHCLLCFKKRTQEITRKSNSNRIIKLSDLGLLSNFRIYDFSLIGILGRKYASDTAMSVAFFNTTIAIICRTLNIECQKLEMVPLYNRSDFEFNIRLKIQLTIVSLVHVIAVLTNRHLKY